MDLVYALLHECPSQPPEEWDPGVACTSLKTRLRKRLHAHVDLRDLLLSVGHDHRPFYFPAHTMWPILECMNAVPDDPWEAALRVALSLVACQMHLRGISPFDEVSPERDPMLKTSAAALVQDICHSIPAKLMHEYSAIIDTPCAGSDSEGRHFARVSLVRLYEAFRESYYPPFTHAWALDTTGYPCFDVRECAFRRECEQGNPSSPYGSVAITLAMARE